MAATEYRKLIVITWLVMAAAMAAIWGPKAWSGLSWDTDDFMRLVQVRDLLAGQSWSDLTQYRLNPPSGTLMHWSRLPDVPIAVVTLILSPILGEQKALLVAAMIVPPIYFLAFLTFFAFAARLLLGRARSPIALLVAIGGSVGIVQFVPGRVDHHGLQLVMMMAALMLLAFGLTRHRWRRAIAWAGIPFALSIWIGAETWPMIVAWFSVLGAAWCYAGGRLARDGAVAGLSGAAIGVAILVTSQPSAQWRMPACDAFSPMPIAMLALIGAGFAVMAVTGRHARTSWARLIIGGACGVAAGGAFILLFPACLSGNYVTIDSVVEQRWLRNVSEAQPWASQFANFPFRSLADVWPSILGVAYCAWRCVRSQERGRLLWGAIGLLTLMTGSLIPWQIRTASLAQSVAMLPLAALVADAIHRIWHKRAIWVRYLAGSLLLFASSVLFWPSVQAGYDAIVELIPGAPAPKKMAPRPCPVDDALASLQGMPPTRILSYIDMGPKILFHTPHSVLAAPYHRDSEGLRNTIDLFSSNDDAWIREKLRAFEIGLIVTCPGPEERTAYRTEKHNGLAERLAAGKMPEYLEQISAPEGSGFGFYRVRTGD